MALLKVILLISSVQSTKEKLLKTKLLREYLNPTKKRMKTTLVGLKEKPTILFAQKDYFGFKSGNSIEIWSENGEFLNMMNLKKS